MNKPIHSIFKIDIMKKVLSVFTIAAFMVACNPKTANEPAVVMNAADTVGFAQFQAWKAEKEHAEYNAYMNQQNAKATTSTARRTSTATKRVSNNTSGSMGSESSNTAKAPEKKGWSKAAKGAVIGAGSGAVAGAIINKRNRAAGAVIGGVIGGGVGYGIGRSMDKKDGRY